MFFFLLCESFDFFFNFSSFKPRASCLQLQAHEDIVGGVAAFK